MRYERAPEAGPAIDRARGRRAGIRWRTVAVQVVGYSVLAWALAAVLGLAIAAWPDRSYLDGLRISAAIVAVAIIGFGLVGLQRGPVAAGGWPGGDVTRLIRPFGMISRPSDSFLRPLRTRTRSVGEDEHNGLTALGVALVVAPQLIVLASVV